MTVSLDADVGQGSIECGEAAAREFAFDQGYKSLNHASYGTYPVAVRDVFRRYQERAEARPDLFVRYEYRTHLLNEARRVIAAYVHAPLECCVLSPNATLAYDTVLRNMHYVPGDVVVCFSSIYEGFENTLLYLAETTPVEIVKVEHVLPVTDDDLCRVFESTIKDLQTRGKTPKMAVFDTVNSLPAVLMPFERLTRICRDNGVLSVVDGAHGAGLMPLDLTRLDADFFVTNCHKWLYVPRGFALLYVPLRNQHLLRATLPTNFAANFASLGTLDDTPYLCIAAALAWRARLSWRDNKDEAAILAYMDHLGREGAQIVAELLGTEVLKNSHGAREQYVMSNVRLPISLPDLTNRDPDKVRAIVAWVMRTMIVEYQTAVVVTPYKGAFWVRLSSQVYLTSANFKEAGEKLKLTCERAVHGGWKTAI